MILFFIRPASCRESGGGGGRRPGVGRVGPVYISNSVDRVPFVGMEGFYGKFLALRGQVVNEGFNGPARARLCIFVGTAGRNGRIVGRNRRVVDESGREAVLAAYNEAVRLEYRFYSFGDAMLIA